MANAITMIVGAILFTGAFELLPGLFGNNPAGDWADVGLYIGFTGFMLSQIVLSLRQSDGNSTSAYE